MLNSMVRQCELIEKSYFGNEERLYTFCFLFLLISILWATYSFFVDFTTLHSNGQFFQRSGSIMVFFGILIEYSLNNIYFAQENVSSKVEESSYPDHHTKPKNFLLLKFLSYFSILFGTFIWGYGDLVLIYFK